MDRLQYHTTANPLRGVGVGDVTYHARGRVEAVKELFHEAVNLKSLSTVATWVDKLDDLGVVPSSSVDYAETSATFLHAAGVVAFPHAIENGMKMVEAGKKLLSNPSWKAATDFTQASAKTVTKSAEALGALHKSHALDLGEAGFHASKVTKFGAHVLSDAIAHGRALDKENGLLAATPAELGMSNATYAAALNEAWWDVARTIAGIAFHLIILLIIAFSLTTISMDVTLVLATCYVVTNVMQYLSESDLRDAKGRDYAVGLRDSGITVHGLR